MNTILKRIHAVISDMFHISDIDMAETVNSEMINKFLTNAVWDVCSTYHMVLKCTPGAAIFGRDMMFDLPFIAD